VSPSRFALRLVSSSALAILACARGPSSDSAPKPSAKPVAAKASAGSPRPNLSPAEAVGMPGPVIPEEQHHHAPPPTTTTLKTVGSIGEELEGDLSYFKLVSIKPCVDPKNPTPAGGAGAKDPNARTVVAAQVEITAKRNLNVNPRDLMLGKGGIMFNASIDPKRELKGCTPLLKLSLLKPKESASGFVLFDLPTWGPGSNLKELNLVYHPARFGGTAQLYVKLAGG
jgi:hypothetical protein